MSKSTVVSDAIHILVYISSDEDHSLTSSAIANSINTNPALVRKVMKLLREADIIETVHGKSEPRLIQDPKDISLKDIYVAVDNNPVIKPDYNTADFCYIGKGIAPVLEEKYTQVQNAMLNEMETITLQSIIDELNVSRSGVR